MPVTKNEDTGIWCFYINDLIHYVTQFSDTANIPFPGKQFIREHYPNFAPYIPERLHPSYLPHIRRWYESCTTLNRNLQIEHAKGSIGPREIQYLKEMGDALNIHSILNETKGQRDPHHMYRLLDETLGPNVPSRMATFWTWVSNFWDWLIKYRIVIAIIRGIVCGINLAVFVSRAFHGTKDRRLWIIFLQQIIGSFLFRVYDTVYSMAHTSADEVIAVLSEMSHSPLGQLMLYFARFIVPWWKIAKVIATWASEEAGIFSLYGWAYSFAFGPQNTAKIRRDTAFEIVREFFSSFCQFVINLSSLDSFRLDMGTLGQDLQTSFLEYFCQWITWFIKTTTLLIKHNIFGASKRIGKDMLAERRATFTRYDDIAKQNMNALANWKNAKAGMIENVAAFSLPYAPVVGTTLAGMNMAREAIKTQREAAFERDSRINDRLIDYMENTVGSYNSMSEHYGTELSESMTCRRIFEIIGKISNNLGPLFMVRDIFLNSWFLISNYSQKEAIGQFLLYRSRNPEYTGDDEKLRLQLDNENNGCVGLFNVKYNVGIDLLDKQDIHDPKLLQRMEIIEQKLREKVKDYKTHKSTDFNALQHAFDNVVNNPEDYKLLRKYKAGQQILTAAHLLGVKIIVPGEARLMNDKDLPVMLDTFFRITSTPFELGANMLSNMYEASNGKYINELIKIHDRDTTKTWYESVAKTVEDNVTGDIGLTDRQRRFNKAEEIYITENLDGIYNMSKEDLEKYQNACDNVLGAGGLLANLCSTASKIFPRAK
jgi:hypothetical protein